MQDLVSQSRISDITAILENKQAKNSPRIHAKSRNLAV